MPSNEEIARKARLNAAIVRTKKKMAQINPPEPTIEDKILQSPIVDNPVVDFAGDVVSAGAKTGSYFLTPFTELARGGVKTARNIMGQDISDTPPIEPWAEFKDPLGAPSERAGFLPLVQEVGELFGVDWNQPTLKPEWEQFPRTSAAIESLSSPAGATAALAELAIPGSSMLKTGRLGSTSLDAARSAGKVRGAPLVKQVLDKVPNPIDRRRVYENWLKTSSSDRVVLQNLLDSGRFDDVVDLLMEDPSLMRPLGMDKTLDVLQGPKMVATKGPYDSVNVYGRDLRSGEIGKYGQYQKDLLGTLDSPGENFRIDRFQDIKRNIMDSLGDYTPSQREAASRFLDDQLSFFSEPYDFYEKLKELDRIDTFRLPRIQKQLIDELKKLRRELGQDYGENFSKMRTLDPLIENPSAPTSYVTGKRGTIDSPAMVNNPEFIKAQNRLQEIQEELQQLTLINASLSNNPKVASLANEFNELSRYIDDQMEITGPYGKDAQQAFVQSQGADYLENLNKTRQRANRYMDIKDFSISPDIKDIQSKAVKGLESEVSKQLEDAIISQLGPAAYQEFLLNNKAMSQRLMLKDLFSSARVPESKVPSLEGRPSTKAATLTFGLADKYILPYTRKAKDAMDSFGAQVGAPMAELSMLTAQTYRIPREIDRIMAEKQLVADKITQEVGEEAARNFMTLEDPDAIKEYLRQLEEVKPDIFTKDKYRRFDGEIKDPTLKSQALEDTLKSSEMSVLDRARNTMELLTNNRLAV